jgi:hypothetical protein
MAKSYPFIRETVDDLIEISSELDKTTLIVALDTGASHTIIDFGILVKEGYRLSDSKGITFLETANGIITANKFIVGNFSCLGCIKNNFEVTSFLFNDPEDTVKGIIGLDFFEKKELCINFNKFEIKIK